MSGFSPYPPPPPPPPPPFDPRDPYRAYREQQRAAWHFQRDAWKVQRDAWRANYARVPTISSIVGPVLLIAVGLVALLIAIGRLNAFEFWSWYGRWWPLLLIAAGLALLGECLLDLRRTTPVRRRGGVVGVLLLMGIAGLLAASWVHAGGPSGFDLGDGNFSLFDGFDHNQHSMQQDVFKQTIAPDATINVQNPGGDVSVVGGDGANFEVHANAIAYGGSDEDAKPIYRAVVPQVTVSGGTVLVRSEGNRRGRVNLNLTVPRGSHLSINSGNGDVTVTNTTGGVRVTASRGDIRLTSLTGSVDVHAAPKGFLSMHALQGDLTTNGACNDLSLAEITGRVTLNCDFFDQVHLERIGGPIHLHTAKTDIQLAELSGDMNLNDEALLVTESHGTVRVATQSRDVELTEIGGDCSVEDRDGTINIEMAGNYNLDARNEKGNLEVTLPQNAAGAVDGSAHNGEIATDFGLSVSGDVDKSVHGTIGAGGHSIRLSASNGDLHIKRRTTSAGASKSGPAPPSRPSSESKGQNAAPVPHLKAPRGGNAKPVTQ